MEHPFYGIINSLKIIFDWTCIYLVEFINNPWVVNVITGVIGSFLIYVGQLIWSYFRRKKLAKDASIEIIKTISRALVSFEIKNININYVNSIRESTYRKYNIQNDLRFSTVDIIHDLVKETTQLEYISNEAKIEIINHLLQLEIDATELTTVYYPNKSNLTKLKYRSDSIYTLTMLFGVTTSVLAITQLFLSDKSSKQFVESLSSDNISPITAASIVCLLIAAIPLGVGMNKLLEDYKNKHK